VFRRKEAEEYEEEQYTSEEEVEQSSLPRWIPAMVVIVALFGFSALAWVAYDSRNKKEEFAEVPLIKNDAAEYRIKPDDEGGMKIAGEDKEIYEAAAGKTQKLDTAKVVEETQPSSGNNMPMEVASSESEEEIANTRAKMFEEESSAKSTESIAAEAKSEHKDVKEASKKAVAIPVNSTASSNSTYTAQAGADAAVANSHPDKINEKAAQAAAAKIAAVNENNKAALVTQPSGKDKASATAENKPKASSIIAKAESSTKPASTATKEASSKLTASAKSTAKSDTKKQISSSGSNRIQLGAYKTEAEAMQAWKKILSQNSDSEALKGRPLKIQKVEIPEKGIFYRLQVNGYGDKHKASMACKEIESSSGCFVVQ